MLSFFPYFLLYRKNAPAAINPRTAAPPTSPPTIAPVLLEDLLLLDVDCVGAAVPEVVEEDEVVELAEDEEEGEEEDEAEDEDEKEANRLRNELLYGSRTASHSQYPETTIWMIMAMQRKTIIT